MPLFGHLVIEGIRQGSGEEAGEGQQMPGRAQFSQQAEDSAAFDPG
jgi:hypothetical protein